MEPHTASLTITTFRFRGGAIACCASRLLQSPTKFNSLPVGDPKFCGVMVLCSMSTVGLAGVGGLTSVASVHVAAAPGATSTVPTRSTSPTQQPTARMDIALAAELSVYLR